MLFVLYVVGLLLDTIYLTSLEWQCFNASAIVHCKIIDCEIGKENNITYEKIKIKIKKIFKGGKNVKNAEVFFHTSHGGLNYSEYKGRECIFFIKFQKKSDNDYRLVPADKSPKNSLINLDNPDEKVFTSDFRILSKKEDVLKEIKEIIAKEEEYYKQTPDIKVKKAVIEIPENSQIQTELSLKKRAFLYVPDIMFPQAEKIID